MKPYAPLGILYLSSHLRANGFDVEIYDSTFGSREDLYRILETEPAGAIGIYANLMTRANALDIAGRAKAAGWLVLFGGPEPSNYAAEYLAAGGDLIVRGEGERALERLASVDFNRAAWPSIPGLIYDGGDSGEPELLRDLDAQPWPDREQIDLERYLQTWRRHHGMSSISVITARGCPFHCNWCSHSVYGHSHRRRKPISVVNEIEWLLTRYSPDMLWLADDVFTIHQGWLVEYAAEMKRRGFRIPFECITRADRLNETSAALLAELGCLRVWIGSESGSERILDAMQRGVTIAQVRRAVELLKQNGIATGMFLMWGYEGEDIEDIEATVEHVKQCRPDTFFTTVSYPIKGTPYFDKVASRLVTLKPWSETTDREFQIRDRHSRRFYQHADELLRNETADVPDPIKSEQARRALHLTRSEVEA
jgi:anaerobic magnesium-protoporphyrin IX monomethyl ester cyclase